MSVFSEQKTEERVSIVRCIVVLLVGIVAAWAYVAHSLRGLPALVVFVCLGTNFLAVVAMLTVFRKRSNARWKRCAYINTAIDMTMMTGVLVAAILSSCEVLQYVVQLAYVSLIAATGFLFHRKVSLFAAFLAIVCVLAVAAAVVFSFLPMQSSVLPHLPILACVMVFQGWFLTVLANDAQLRLLVYSDAERLNERIINEVFDGLLVCDASGTIVELNAASIEVLGLPREVMLDLDAFSVLPGPLANELKLAWNEVLSSGFVAITNVTFPRHDTNAVVDVTAYRMQFRGDQVVHLVLRDITAQAELTERRAVADRLTTLQSLWRSFIHEFSNAFASIEASSFTLEQAIDEKDPLYQDVQVIRTTTARGGALLQEVRDLTDTARTRHVPVKVIDAVNRALAAVDLPGFVKLVVQVEPTTKQALGDASQLDRVLVSLIRTALDAMLDGGILTIRAKNRRLLDYKAGVKRGEYVQIVVEDTGIGMSAEAVAKAFELGGQGGGDKWVGLALRDVRALVHRYGGSLELESNLGRGTGYTVLWPATDEPAATSEVPTTVPLPKPGHTKRLLIVDDEVGNRQSLGRLLRNNGYEVTLAEDGRHAIELCTDTDGQFDLVLLDLVMPGLNGKDVLEALLARWPAMRVMLVTGFADRKLVEETVSVGAVGYCMKPFNVPELLKKIDRICSTSLGSVEVG